MSYESFYEGLSNNYRFGVGEDTNPESLFQGYRVPFKSIGAPTKPDTANAISEVNARMNEGIRTVEVQALSPQVFETIPKQHFREINRMAKLTGADITLHAPMLDLSGYGEQGFNDNEREEVQERLKDVIALAHDLNPNGNIPITIHASNGIPATVPKKPGTEREGDLLYVVDKNTGQAGAIRRETRYDSNLRKDTLVDPEEQLKEINKRMIERDMTDLIYYADKAEEMARVGQILTEPFIEKIRTKKIREDELLPQQKDALNKLRIAQTLYDQMESQLDNLYRRTNKFIPEEAEEETVEAMQRIRDNLTDIKKRRLVDVNPMEASEKFSRIISDFREISENNPPVIYGKTEDFALERAKKTIAEAALYGYNQFGETAPIVSIENFFPGTAFSTGKGMKKLIEESRKEFVNIAKTKGISENEAQQAAEKLIGATWDVGHLNLLRKHGYTEEDIARETKEVAKFVKHVHLTDNFGYNDTHLVPGMGNVPFKKIFEELEKAGFKGKEIVEAGGFVAQGFGSPTQHVLEALGSPIYAAEMAQNWKGQMQYWNQIRQGAYSSQGTYSQGYGLMLPEGNFSIYGSGFSTLPQELGGQVAGRGQRFSGKPME